MTVRIAIRNQSRRRRPLKFLTFMKPFLFLSIAIAPLALVADDISNSAISNEYASMSTTLVQSAKELFEKSLQSNVHGELAPVLRTIAYVRNRDAVPLLLENLGYTDERPKNRDTFDNTFHHLALGCTSKFQSTSALYPCVGVLSRTGLLFDQLKGSIGIYHPAGLYRGNRRDLPL